MSLEDLTKYESAAIAAMKEKHDPALALGAMYDFYKSLGLENDPFVAKGFEEAQKGLQYAMQTGKEPTITSLGLMQAIGLYGGQFEKAFVETPIGDLYSYLGGACSVPEEAKNAIMEFKDSTYKDLAEKLKDDASESEKENLGKVVQSLGLLRELKLEGSYINIKKSNIEETLSQMYKPKPKGEK